MWLVPLLLPKGLFSKSFNLLVVDWIKIDILVSTKLTNQQPINFFLSKIRLKINLTFSSVVCRYPVCVYQRVGSVQTEVCIRRQSTTALGGPGGPQYNTNCLYLQLVSGHKF